MGHLLFVLFQTLRRNLFLFTFIVLVLASGNWIRSEWRHIQSIVGQLPSLQSGQKHVNEHQAALANKIAQQVRQQSGATVRQLDAEIRTLDDEINRLQQEQDKVSILSAAVKGGDAVPEQLTQAVMRKVEIELRRQAREHLISLRAHVDASFNRQAALNKLQRIQLAHVQVYADLQRALKQRADIQAAAGLRSKIFFTETYKQVEALNRQAKVLRATNEKLHKDFLAQQALVNRLPSFTAPAAFRVDEQRLAAAAAPLHDRLRWAEDLAAQNYVWRAYQAVRPLLPVALGVLLGLWLVPAAIRTLFYFVLAPLAARRPPIVIHTPSSIPPALPSTGQGSAHDSSLISAVSQTVMLAPDHEMLVRPDYCQSQPAGVRVRTKLLFDWHRWLTSIAAHLWMLKQLRTTQAADIVVSSTVDALDEVALLEIAPGEAFVLQPRGLAGVMYKTGQRPKIRSHWRLTTLHAWLTLQLRYLAFEGPVTLIVKGCRGVRLENALVGQTISQDATLGFSANAIYATIRAEPFLPYLRGRQSLFHDKFDGHNACYLYEEVPRNARPDQQKNNPLEMLLDASLKAFGI